MNEKNDTMIANAFDEYYIFRRQNGTYYIQYSQEFYEKHAKVLPQFNVFEEAKFTEELSEKEFKEFLEDTREYYGEACITDPAFKKK